MFIVAEYVSKYESGLNNKEIKKIINQKCNHLINKNLFKFSRSCKKLIIPKTLKYFPYDLKHPQYQLTSFYLKNILEYSQEHPFYQLLRNSYIKKKQQKNCF